MHPSPEITIDMTAEELLQTLSDDDCFEVDDIAALDPVATPVPTVTKAAADEADMEMMLNDAEMSLEIELSADDMNALLDADLAATGRHPAPSAEETDKIADATPVPRVLP